MALSLALDLTTPAPPGSIVSSISTPADLKAELTDEEYNTFCKAARTKGGFADKWFKLTPDEAASLAAPPYATPPAPSAPPGSPSEPAASTAEARAAVARTLSLPRPDVLQWVTGSILAVSGLAPVPLPAARASGGAGAAAASPPSATFALNFVRLL